MFVVASTQPAVGPTPVDFNYINLPVMNSTCGMELIVRWSGYQLIVIGVQQLVTGQCHLYSVQSVDCDEEM